MEKLNSYQRLKLRLKELQQYCYVLKLAKKFYQEALEDVAEFAMTKVDETMHKVRRLEDEKGTYL